MISLITRLEALTGPSREVDAEILAEWKNGTQKEKIIR